jgi:hypothetical protein
MGAIHEKNLVVKNLVLLSLLSGIKNSRAIVHLNGTINRKKNALGIRHLVTDFDLVFMLNEN